MKIHLLVIDPQNDFCREDGALFVPGADEDVERLAGMVRRLRDQLAAIHVTLDSHRIVDISHPIWWTDPNGEHPSPFTTIRPADVESGRFTTTQPGALARSLAYLRALEQRDRHAHVVWPTHCLIGDPGHDVAAPLAAAIHDWETRRFAMTDFVTKGSNPWTEHFSAVQAEVPDPADPGSQANTGLIEALESADVVLVAGEARSHCVASTVRDLAARFAPASVGKLVLVTDAMSDVPDSPGTTLFSDLGAALVRDVVTMGAKITTTRDFLA